MTAPIASARLAQGAWVPSTEERQAARLLSVRLDRLDGEPAITQRQAITARRQRAETVLAAIRHAMKEAGPDLYRPGRVSLYSVLRSAVLELSPLQLAVEDFAPDDPEAWMRAEAPDLEYRLWHAEQTIKQLRELLAEVAPAR